MMLGSAAINKIEEINVDRNSRIIMEEDNHSIIFIPLRWSSKHSINMSDTNELCADH